MIHSLKSLSKHSLSKIYIRSANGPVWKRNYNKSSGHYPKSSREDIIADAIYGSMIIGTTIVMYKELTRHECDNYDDIGADVDIYCDHKKEFNPVAVVVSLGSGMIWPVTVPIIIIYNILF
jgi:hypothetical protein